MSKLKGGGLLLIMGIPLALYGVLQVKGAAGAGASEPPAERGATREQIAAARARSSAWINEVRKASAVTSQYRGATAEDVSSDAEVSSLVKTAAARAADLNDLDLFLSDIDRPDYRGRLRPQYEKWTAERRGLKRNADAVELWLAKPLAINSTSDATKALDAGNELIDKYLEGSARFSDTAKATVWRIKARMAVIDGLAALADRQYRAAVQVKLPLEPGANKVVTTVETLGALRNHIAELDREVKQATAEKIALDAATPTAVEAKGAVADEAVAREELLTLFARKDLFTNATGAAEWLKEVAAQYRKTKDQKIQALIRDKVQEFCAAFIPRTARLDDNVLIKGKPVPRKEVVIKYQEDVGGKVMRAPLAAELDGLNEFNVTKRHPGATTFVVHGGSEEYPRDLQPTPLSQAAVQYNADRGRRAENGTEPNWTAKTVAELKKKCEPRKDLVDQLQSFDASVGNNPRIWTRLESLAAGMMGNADLFEAGP